MREERKELESNTGLCLTSTPADRAHGVSSFSTSASFSSCCMKERRGKYGGYQSYTLLTKASSSSDGILDCTAAENFIIRFSVSISLIFLPSMTVSRVLLLLMPPLVTAPGCPDDEELTLRLSSDIEPDEDATLFTDGVVVREVS